MLRSTQQILLALENLKTDPEIVLAAASLELHAGNQTESVKILRDLLNSLPVGAGSDPVLWTRAHTDLGYIRVRREQAGAAREQFAAATQLLIGIEA